LRTLHTELRLIVCLIPPSLPPALPPTHPTQINVPGDVTAFARAYNGKDDFEFDCEVEGTGEPKLCVGTSLSFPPHRLLFSLPLFLPPSLPYFLPPSRPPLFHFPFLS